MRDDLALKDYAESLGFTANVRPLDLDKKVPSFPYMFSKGDYRVWRIREGWQTARLQDTPVGYEGHKPFKGLKEALDYVNNVA